MNGWVGRCPSGSGCDTAGAPTKAGEVGPAFAGTRVAARAAATTSRVRLRRTPICPLRSRSGQGSTYDGLVLPCGSGLGCGGLPALAPRGLLLRRRPALGRVAAGTGLLAAVRRGIGRVGDPGRPLLGHPLVLQ